ncbi:MAG: elongation factor P maturation arginine rhamnosyltransferase EarP [Burkholderiales bacterium]|jgi:uncharacterized repeat protein (TIGR03837 family)|nr:elongation factor P maturation arginine rhamnosyltransferase EarP [Burkholderiales bacterium]
MSISWLILCRVVDHYGDAGVCWRLARQLAYEYDLDVTLFIDDIATLQRLVPTLDTTQDCQHIDRVIVRRLTDTLPPPVSCTSVWPDVIIDAFGGGLPPSWLEALEHDFPPFATSFPSPLAGEGLGERERFSTSEKGDGLSSPSFVQTNTLLSSCERVTEGTGEDPNQPWLIQRARELRKQQTPHEYALWQQLRAKRFSDYKFRRQQPLGRFIVDFVCFPQRLIVELDGGQHADVSEYDAQRDTWLEHEGFRILRFWNNEWTMQQESVLEAIWRALQEPPPLPQPLSHKGRGEQRSGISIGCFSPKGKDSVDVVGVAPEEPLSPCGRGAGERGRRSSYEGENLEGAKEENVKIDQTLPKAPHWIILEYLSAEPWVETMHRIASPPPSINVPRHFFFPGFTKATGGLLREKTLLDERDAFQRSFPDTRRAFLEHLGVPALSPDALLVSLFCYDILALPALLDVWAASPSPIACLIPETIAPVTVQRWQNLCKTDATSATHGALTLHTIPFLPQADYDRLLWSCDLNFVRGEDSFVRAQWAAKPFVWQAYRQEEQAHLTKVDAFLKHYLADASDPLKTALSDFTCAWNNELQTNRIAETWLLLAEQLPAFRKLAHGWTQQLSTQTDLAQQLVAFGTFTGCD